MKQKILNGTSGRRVINILCVFFSFINIFIPKKKNQYLFYNSKEVYLNNYSYLKYMLENNKLSGKKVYYSMPNIADKEILDSDIICISSMIETLYIFLRSEIIFYDTGNIRINPSKNQIVLNLWHGTPLKRIGHSAKKVPKDLQKNSINKFTKVIIASEYFKDIYIDAFNIKEEQITIGGQPRLDRLLKPKETSVYIKNKQMINVMWMTTYRISYDGRLKHTDKENWSDTELPVLTTVKDLIELNGFLTTLNINLIIKIHHGSVFDENKILDSLSNITIIKDIDFISKGIELYDLLGNCDSLITDYSSVFFDYLILNKPIGFIINDMDNYEKNNGFNFEKPLKIMPGEKIHSKNELKRFFINIKNNEDIYLEERKKVNNLVNRYQTFGNCERINKLVEVKDNE